MSFFLLGIWKETQSRYWVPNVPDFMTPLPLQNSFDLFASFGENKKFSKALLFEPLRFSLWRVSTNIQGKNVKGESL